MISNLHQKFVIFTFSITTLNLNAEQMRIAIPIKGRRISPESMIPNTFVNRQFHGIRQVFLEIFGSPPALRSGHDRRKNKHRREYAACFRSHPIRNGGVEPSAR